MRLPKSIRDNLRFLIAEVGSQMANLQFYFDTGSENVAQRIVDRSGYAYNLKMRIHNSCLGQLSRTGKGDTRTLALRAAESISTDIERVAELCRECIHEMTHLKCRKCLKPSQYTSMLNRVIKGIEMVEPAIENNDTDLALKIGHIEIQVDRDYRKMLKRYTALLKKGRHTEDFISALFVAHSVEQMGDALLNISEAIISVNLGQPINIDRYYHLMESVGRLEANENTKGLSIEHVAETRSGSAISAISKPEQGKDSYVAIFKDGQKRKLKEEREGVENWHEIYPGLAPQILSYHKRGQSASLLIEHLAGLTFEQILLHEPQKRLDETLRALNKTLKSVWRETRGKKKVAARYMDQLSKRLPEVYEIHPEFQQSNSRVCGMEIPSFDTLLKQAKHYETHLKAPFSVYIHGDFNVDNIIYDPIAKRINFIDLHRSRHMDYVQDVSVFMVSNYRLQILDKPLRRRILGVAEDFYRRFILDKSLARAMMLRARYLLECVLRTDPKVASSFRIPIQEIFVG